MRHVLSKTSKSRRFKYRLPDVMCNRWYFLVVFIGVLFVSNYVWIKSENSSSVRPKIKSMFDVSSNLLPVCCNPLFCPIEGTWMLRNDVSLEKLKDVLNTNMELRVRKGWPTSLVHGDSRCGKRYPLARVLKYNNSMRLYSDIVSQCDGFSATPCCREDMGWCGAGPGYCTCETCTDYSSVVYAELFTWSHKSRCRYFDLEGNDSCQFLKQLFTSITFIGDSLVRHVFSSLLIHLTSDLLYGGLRFDASDRDLKFCGGENQYVDSSCHVKLATKWEEVRRNPKYCPLLREKPPISFVQAYGSALTWLALDSIAVRLKESRPLIVVGIGIHDNFNTTKVIGNYLNPIVQLIKRTRQSRPVLVWLNTHAAGPLKPLGFQASQGNAKIRKFNEEMVRYCYANSIIVFDTFNLTRGVHSFDGTHYGSALNMLKVKLLINGLLDLPEIR